MSASYGIKYHRTIKCKELFIPPSVTAETNDSGPMLRRTIAFFSTLVPVLAISGCTTGMQTVDSANHNSRVSIVVIHHTAIDFGTSLSVLTEPSSRPVSSHYLIPEPDDDSYERRQLKTYQLVDEYRRAWHAGVSYWGGKTGLNDQSIGIELVNTSWCHRTKEYVNPETGLHERLCFYPDFADGQIALLVELLEGILERHPDIKPTNIVGHSDIAPGRKVDPGPRFPWERLARMGYGAWYDDETVLNYWERFLADPLPLINVQKALAAYGYKIEPTGEYNEETADVLQSFQLHFRAHEVTREPSIPTVATLFALIEKYYPEQLDELLLVEEPVPAEVPDDGPTDAAAAEEADTAS